MRLVVGLVALAMSFWTAKAMEILMDQTDENNQFCTGMYGRKTWGGPVDPFILVKFLNNTSGADDAAASLIIFEWRDKDFIGVPDPEFPGNLFEVCDQEFVKKGACNETNIGEFIVADNATEKSGSIILTKAVNLKEAGPIRYGIKKTGYYCILTNGFTASEYEAVVEFRNAYGELPATQIPKLPFYGGITILYALVAVFWGFLYYQHRSDILPVQNYITAILIFLVVEMLLTWGFYDYQNRHGSNVGAKIYLIVVAILNAFRSSFSFFLLLIVSMGYGVVKPTLGQTMVWVRWLAIAHFVFGLAYAVTSLLVSPEDAGIFVLLVVLPLAGTMTGFYVWTLNSLNLTLKDLRERKQYAKEAMYKKLWWAILVSIIVIFGFFFFNSFTFASVNDPDFVPFHWKTRWFVLDGWLNIVYFADVAWIAYVWRPTANNRRFAMSDEIAQDDDGNFEIADIGMPGDSDDEDEESRIGKNQPSATNGSGHVGLSQTGGSSRQQAPARDLPRDSLEGETIFAVGEDGDRFSDDEEEDTKLVRSK
ncbi:lung seven transmembrane receptor-domain-containing protein [Stachybotrys elegans]|uniref:Lung seven transmembrane receptor-domain-containing protein n=1 Tax=Stachybotrys elegans TaxID=80388 RepID=A0A8K0SN82_9HYPO|nr:lung seven transmembrane receptor-domain-containing protein [Stachybotrys elegans]